MFKRMSWMVWILLFSVMVSVAQETCDAIVQQAIETASVNCDGLRRNEACYGNVTIDAEAAPDADNFVFNDAGDIVNVSDIASMRLSSQVEETGEWGISPMLLQMNLADESTINVQMILFGDVELERPSDQITIDAISTGQLNVRAGPSTNFSIVGTLSNGEIIALLARNEAGDWVQFVQSDGTIGWVFVPLLTISDSVTDLVVTNEESTQTALLPSTLTTFGTIEAFTIRTGNNDSPCEIVPDSGVLIQTPEGVGQISFRVNEVRVNLSSTMYITSSDDNELIFGLIEGHSTVRAQGTTVGLVAGTQTRVEILDDVAISSPQPPELLTETNWSEDFLSLLDRSIDYVSYETAAEIPSIENVALDDYQLTWQTTSPPECQTIESSSTYENGRVTLSFSEGVLELASTLADTDELFPTQFLDVGSGVFTGVGSRPWLITAGGNVPLFEVRQYTAWIVDEDTIEGIVTETFIISEPEYQDFLDEIAELSENFREGVFGAINGNIEDALACPSIQNSFTLIRS